MTYQITTEGVSEMRAASDDYSLSEIAEVVDIVQEFEVHALNHILLAKEDLDAFLKDEVSLDLLIDGLTIFRDDLAASLKNLKKLNESEEPQKTE